MYNAVVEVDMRNMITAQESFYVRNERYSVNLTLLKDAGYRQPDGVRSCFLW